MELFNPVFCKIRAQVHIIYLIRRDKKHRIRIYNPISLLIQHVKLSLKHNMKSNFSQDFSGEQNFDIGLI